MATSTLPIEELLAQTQAFIQGTQSAAKKIQENAAQSEKVSGRVKEIYDTVAVDAATVEATKQAAQLKVQQKNAEIAVAGGVDMNASADRLTDLHKRTREANDKAIAAVGEFERASNSKFTDNPLGFIVDQLKLPILHEEANASIQKANVIQAALDSENNSLQNSFQTTEKLKESVTASSAAAASRIAAAQSMIGAQQAQLAGLKYNTEGIEAVQNASKDQLNAAYTAFNAVKSEQQAKMALANHALDLERFNWQKEERRAAQEAKQEAKEIDDTVIESINRSLISQGMPAVTGKEAKSAVTLLKSGASKELAYHYENGRRIKGLGVATVGASPAESLKAMEEISMNLPEIRKETSGVLAAARQALALNKTIDQKDKKAVDNFINGFVNQQISAQYSSISPNSQNLFDVGDISQYFGLSSVSNLPVVARILAPLAAQKQSLNDPKLVLALLNSEIKKGTLTTSEASDLSTVYRVANETNQMARGFIGFGIVPPNAGKNYNAKVSSWGKPVDMTDPSAIQRYFAKQAAEELDLRFGRPAPGRRGSF